MFSLTKLHLNLFLFSGIILCPLPSADAQNLNSTKALTLQKIQSYNVNVSAESYRLALNIYKVMQPYLLDFDIDSCMVGGNCTKTAISEENAQKVIKKIATLIENQQPLDFYLLAYPFKSGNRDRNVEGKLADMAERKSLEHLNQFISNIQKIYLNASLTIYTDGLLFSDLFEISDQIVAAYEDSLKELSSDFQKIKIITFLSLLNEKKLIIEDVRKAVDAQTNFDGSNEITKKRVFNEINHSNHTYFSKNPADREKVLNRLSNLVLRRVKWVGDFVKQFQNKDSIHLSVHYQKDMGHKVGIKMSENSLITPTNGVLVQERDGTYSIKYKNQVDLIQYQPKITTINGVNCHFYQWR